MEYPDVNRDEIRNTPDDLMSDEQLREMIASLGGGKEQRLKDIQKIIKEEEGRNSFIKEITEEALKQADNLGSACTTTDHSSSK